MEIMLMKKINNLAIVRFEEKINFFFNFQEVKNDNYLFLHCGEYCLYVFNKKTEEFYGAFFQVFEDGLFSNESDYFIAFYKINNKTYCSIYNEKGKLVLEEKDFTFIYPVGIIKGKNNLILAEKEIEKNYKIIYLFSLDNQFNKIEIKKIDNLEYFNQIKSLDEYKMKQ